MRKLKSYILLTFLITYVTWGVVAVYTQLTHTLFSSSYALLLLYVLGVIGPAIAALAVTRRLDSRAAFKAFYKNCLIPPKNLRWYLFILGVTAVFGLLPFFLAGGMYEGPLVRVLFLIPLYIVIGGLEEVGWRGLLQPELDKRFSPLISTGLVGLIWSVWHLPLFFILGTYQKQYLNFFIYIISTTALAFLLSVVYHRTRSIFLCILTHALFNSIAAVFITPASWKASLVLLALALALFTFSGRYGKSSAKPVMR